MAGSANSADVLREIASEVGFELDEEGASVIDHLNYDVKDEGQHTLVVAEPENLVKATPIVGQPGAAPLLYQGTGILADRENPLVIEVLTASSSAYSYNPDSDITEVRAVGRGWDGGWRIAFQDEGVRLLTLVLKKCSCFFLLLVFAPFSKFRWVSD